MIASMLPDAGHWFPLEIAVSAKSAELLVDEFLLPFVGRRLARISADYRTKTGKNDSCEKVLR
jgi:hypothetical protein